MAQETGGDEDIARAMAELVHSCTFGKIDSENAALFDVEYLFLRIRGKSVGEQIELQIKCEHCEELNPLQIDVNDIKVQNLKSDNIVMVTDTVGLKMRWPSVETFGALDIDKLNTV